MQSPSWSFAVAALVASGTLAVGWSLGIQRLRMRQWLPWLRALAVITLVLGVASLVLASSWGPRGLAAVALVVPAFFVVVGTVAEQPPGSLAVRVGQPILDFTAPDARGEPFAMASLRGRPYLLKFYRGHW